MTKVNNNLLRECDIPCEWIQRDLQSSCLRRRDEQKRQRAPRAWGSFLWHKFFPHSESRTPPPSSCTPVLCPCSDPCAKGCRRATPSMFPASFFHSLKCSLRHAAQSSGLKTLAMGRGRRRCCSGSPEWRQRGGLWQSGSGGEEDHSYHGKEIKTRNGCMDNHAGTGDVCFAPSQAACDGAKQNAVQSGRN